MDKDIFSEGFVVFFQDDIIFEVFWWEIIESDFGGDVICCVVVFELDFIVVVGGDGIVCVVVEYFVDIQLFIELGIVLLGIGNFFV